MYGDRIHSVVCGTRANAQFCWDIISPELVHQLVYESQSKAMFLFVGSILCVVVIQFEAYMSCLITDEQQSVIDGDYTNQSVESMYPPYPPASPTCMNGMFHQQLPLYIFISHLCHFLDRKKHMKTSSKDCKTKTTYSQTGFSFFVL